MFSCSIKDRTRLKVVRAFTNPPNLLKSKIPMSGRGGGGRNQLSTFDAEFKFAKIQNSHFWGGGGGGNQISTFDAEFKFAEIQNSDVGVGGGGGGVGGWWNQLSTFDAEFKFAEIQNSHFWRGGGVVEPTFNF